MKSSRSSLRQTCGLPGDHLPAVVQLDVDRGVSNTKARLLAGAHLEPFGGDGLIFQLAHSPEKALDHLRPADYIAACPERGPLGGLCKSDGEAAFAT